MRACPSVYVPPAASESASELRARPLADWKVNNFDLVRLFAALQVASAHALLYLGPAGVPTQLAQSVLGLFPGVPIFFVVSGILVSRSYEHTGSLQGYYRNRCLRIFPALWVCLVVSLGIVSTVGVVSLGIASRGEWLTWWAAQMTFFQTYWPAFLGAWPPAGSLNPSLWTLPVELEFYLVLPVLYRLFRSSGRWGPAGIGILLLLSYAIELALVHEAASPSATVRYAALRMTVLPYLWMFLVGVLVQRNWLALRGWFVGRAPGWLIAYLLLCVGARALGLTRGGNDISPVFLLPLAGLVVSAATSAPGLSDRLLRHHDVSYGLYIYHMPVIAVMGRVGLRSFPLAIAASVAIAIASWTLVEKPFLLSKRTSLRAVA